MDTIYLQISLFLLKYWSIFFEQCLSAIQHQSMCGRVDDYSDYTINFLYQFKYKVGIENSTETRNEW